MELNQKEVEADMREKIRIKTGLGVRHVQMVLLFFLVAATYSSRFNLSLAIVAMTTNGSSSNPDIPVYDWKDNSVVLSSFYWGYVVFPIIAAQLAQRWGVKIFLVTTMCINALACFLSPTMSENFGSKGLMMCRVLQGLAQGFCFPSIHTMLGLWAPAPERSRFSVFVYSGASIGNIVALPITGLLCASWYGWPSSFYLFGSICVLCAVCFAIFGSNRPSEHKSINMEERRYIEDTLGQIEGKTKMRTPWRKILKSPPFWAIFFSNIGVNFGVIMLSNETPTYMNKVLGFDISKNGFLSTTPNIASCFGSMFFSPICDYLINAKYLTRGSARKIFNSIGMIVPAILIICIGLIPNNMVTLSVAFFIINGFANTAHGCGFQVNLVDLSPNHAGTLMGMSNGTTNIFAIISPLVVNFVVTDETDQTQWLICFIIASAVIFLTNLVYIIFASGEIQSWNDEIKDEMYDIEQKNQNQINTF